MPTPNVPCRRAARRRRRWRSLLAAAVAAPVAAVLLLGGPASLASWRVASTAHPGSFTTGALALIPIAANGASGCSQWTFTTTGGTSSGAYTNQPLQPGDTLTASCRYTLTAQGDHLKGHISVGAPPTAPPAPLALTTTAVTVGGASRSTFTSGDTGSVVEVDLALSVPASDQSNPAADVSYVLHNLTVSAVQDQP